MSILSKIFIVLLVVLSIAVAVSVLVVQRDVLGPLEKNAGLEKDNQMLSVAMAAEKTDHLRRENDLNAKLQADDSTVSRLQAENNQLRGQCEQLTAQADTAAQKIDEAKKTEAFWEAQATGLQKSMDKAQKDIEAVKADYEKATRSYNQTSTQLSQVTGQRDYALERVKNLTEQLKILQDKINNSATNASSVQPSGTEATHAVVAGPTIKGTVKAVADNMTMAELDVGANDGVQENMQFTIFRKGGKFIGQLVVTRVDAKSSVGRLELVQDRVQIDDKAQNQLAAN